MRVQDFLGVGEGSVQSGSNNCKIFGHLLVIDEVVRLLVVLADLLVQRRIADCSHSPNAQLGDSLSLGHAQKLAREHCGGVQGGTEVVVV